MRSTYFVHGVLLALVLGFVGCKGGSTTARNNNTSPPAQPPQPHGPVFPDEPAPVEPTGPNYLEGCPIVFEKSRVDAYQRASLKKPTSLSVVPVFRPQVCQSGDVSITGYTQLTVRKAIQPTGALRSHQGDILLPFKQTALTLEEKKALASSLNANVNFNEKKSFFEDSSVGSFAELSDTAFAEVKVESRDLGQGPQSVLVFDSSSSLNFATSKNVAIRLWDGPADGRIQTTTLQSLMHEQRPEVRVLTSGEAVAESWRSIPAFEDLASERRTLWIAQYRKWLQFDPKLKTSPHLSVVIQDAQRMWDSRVSRTSNASAVIGYLLFLHTLKPEGATQVYVRQYEILKAFFNRNTQPSLLKEILKWVGANPYSADQQAFLFRAAKDLKNDGISDSWKWSTEIATHLNFDPAKYRAFQRMIVWLRSPMGADSSTTDAYERTIRFVSKYAATQREFDLFATTYSWLTGSKGPQRGSYQALTDAEEWVMVSKMTSEAIEVLKSAYAWLITLDSAQISQYLAFEKATKFVVEEKMSTEQLQVLKATYEWLKSISDLKFEAPMALEKAEDSVFKKKITAAQLEERRQYFAWLISEVGPGMTPAVALETVEAPAANGTAPALELEKIQAFFSWLKSERGPLLGKAAAYTKALDYVSDLKITDERFEILQSAFAWLTRATGPEFNREVALRESEELTTKGDLTKEQAPLLVDGFQWLKSARGPAKNLEEAYARVKAYVIEKKMDAAQLEKLGSLFSDYRTQGSTSAALARAEKEVLGASLEEVPVTAPEVSTVEEPAPVTPAPAPETPAPAPETPAPAPETPAPAPETPAPAPDAPVTEPAV